MAIVGLADKAVAELRERVRAALASIGLALSPKRIAINLAPADVVKEGAHYDLSIALGLLLAIGTVPADAVYGAFVIGELLLHGGIEPVSGVLPAAIAAVGAGMALICPKACGPGATWARDPGIVAAPDLMSLLNHLRGSQMLAPPGPELIRAAHQAPEMSDPKGHETARRVLEIVAAGQHNLLLEGLPGAAKPILAARLPGLLPPLSPREALDITMLHSVAGQLPAGGLIQTRQGEISLAHGGVLFLDELAEFTRPVLDALRQPLETGQIVVARANHHVTYPARFQLVVAMNLCRCGYLGDPARACTRASDCGRNYCARTSDPIIDRFDTIIELLEVSGSLLPHNAPGEPIVSVARHVVAARDFAGEWDPEAPVDAASDISGDGRALLEKAIETQSLSARGFHRILRVARTISDLKRSDGIDRRHLAEAPAYRAMPLLA